MTIKTHGRMVTDNSVGITQLNVSDGTDAQALVTDGSGTLRFATVGAGGAVGSSTFIEDIRAGDGSTVTFSLSTAAPYEESIMVFIDGVAQPTSAYTITSSGSGVGAGGAFDCGFHDVLLLLPLAGLATGSCGLRPRRAGSPGQALGSTAAST